MKYCKACKRNVTPIKYFSIAWFLINCLYVVGCGLYIIYYIFFKKKVCPICHSHEFKRSTLGNDDIEDDAEDFATKLSNFNAKMKESTERMKKKNEQIALERKQKKLEKLNKN